MKLPRLLDRERRIHDLSVLLREKTLASTMWFRQYQKLSAAVAIARAERDNAREDRDTNHSELEAAQKQADSLRSVVDSVRREHAKDRSSWYEQRDAHLAEIRRLEREMEGRQVPVAVAAPADRAGLYRLEEENARLRAENADLKRKYQGVPS